jgi:hypothetical protein
MPVSSEQESIFTAAKDCSQEEWLMLLAGLGIGPESGESSTLRVLSLPAKEATAAIFATKRLQGNRAKKIAFGQSSSLGPANFLTVTSRAMTHYLFSPRKLDAVVRVGREVPKISCEGYSTD